MSGLFRKPKPPVIVQAPPPPPVPTIDEAAKRDENYRKIHRRRGHKANVSGSSAGASVAARTLLG